MVALSIGVDKVGLPFDRAFFLGILCNVLVCLAVWLSLGARSTADKVLAVLFPISGFVAAGFEHSVANMYLIPLALLVSTVSADPTLLDVGQIEQLTWAAFLWSLVPVTLGNIVGGGVLVGGVYWFVYLRPVSQEPLVDG
jgi:formate/nitrite transporter